jgi:hypothetical protein
LGQKATRKEQAHTGRENSRTSQIVSLLERPSGASLAEITKLVGWRDHSVRGFISGQLRKRLGMRVKSFKRDRERIYAIEFTT